MKELMPRKYRLLWPKEVVLPSGEKKWLHRLKATRDIPLHGIKKGDLGGFVSSKHVLSHEGDAWITESAIVEHTLSDSGYGPLRNQHDRRKNMITGNALITGAAYVVASYIHNAQVQDNAIVRFSSISGSDCHISGNSKVLRSKLDGAVRLSKEALVDDATLSGNIMLSDKAELFNVRITSNGLVGVLESAKVTGTNLFSEEYSELLIADHAVVTNSFGNQSDLHVGRGMKSTIAGRAYIGGSMLAGEFSMAEDTKILKANLRGIITFTGNVIVPEGCALSGTTAIEGPFRFDVGNYVDGKKVKPETQSKPAIKPKLNNYSKEEKQKMLNTLMATGSKPRMGAENTSSINGSRYFDIIQETLDEYEAYTTDLVKLIKYPAMADASIIETQSLLVAIKRAKRAMDYPEEIEALKKASDEIEHAFVVAETKAKALASEYLDDKTKSKLKKADTLIALACNEGATDNEKQSSVKATLNTLTGIFEVSDAAVENLKARVGILEIEA